MNLAHVLRGGRKFCSIVGRLLFRAQSDCPPYTSPLFFPVPFSRFQFSNPHKRYAVPFVDVDWHFCAYRIYFLPRSALIPVHTAKPIPVPTAEKALVSLGCNMSCLAARNRGIVLRDERSFLKKVSKTPFDANGEVTWDSRTR